MKKPKPSRRPQAGAQQSLAEFIQGESVAGLVLVLATVLALVVSNTPGLAVVYERVLDTPITVTMGNAALSKPLLLWINDGLMALFFFLVGMEIKREVLEGQLSSRQQVLLPAVAALGGMVAPAAFYSLFNWGDPVLIRGWAIPAATDIAFALGTLSLVGPWVPVSIKVFLLTIATLDDLGAIIIIALFYTENLSLTALILGLSALAVAVGMNKLHVQRIAPYIFVGLVMWLFVLKSGVHATMVGMALALVVPLRTRNGEPLLEHVMEALHPYVTYAILPIFAFANAGIPLGGVSIASLLDPLPLGIVTGLCLGKPLGIMGAVLLSVGLGFAHRPEGTNWLHILGVSCLAGIGFTMSLFIGSLAFTDHHHLVGVRIGVLTASSIAAVVGFLLLWASRRSASRGYV